MSIFYKRVHQPINTNEDMRTQGKTLSRKDSIIALWREGVSITETARRLGLTRGAVSGCIQRYKIKNLGFVPEERGYYRNYKTPNKTWPTWGYNKYTPFSHELDTHVEREARRKLKDLLK